MAMVTVKVLRPFRDLMAGRNREPGDAFEATEARAVEIATKLPGYVELPEPEPAEPDYDSMRVSELRALAEERGVAVPKGAKKADLVRALRG